MSAYNWDATLDNARWVAQKRYNPEQPRDPAGTPTGGRWTSSGKLPVQQEPGGRAPAGGMVGINGLFYPGGSFLPSTQGGKTNEDRLTKKKPRSGKREIGPREWAEKPTETAESIWAAVVGTYASYDAGRLSVYAPAVNAAFGAGANPEIMFQGKRLGQLSELINAWNGGARWVEPLDERKTER